MKLRPVTALMFAAAAAAGLAASAVTAAPLPALSSPALFLSPAGKPFRSKAGEPYPVVVWFAEADANKDGKIDKAELRADADAWFVQLDRDKNGIIEGQEISFYENRVVPEMLANQQYGLLAPGLLAPGFLAHGGLIVRAQYGGVGGGGLDNVPVVDADQETNTKSKKKVELNLQGCAPYNFLREPEPLTASDSDFNHRITKDEFAAASDRRFKILDKDGDGFLTLDTLPGTATQNALGGGKRR